MTSATSPARLLADIGGTNARFAWQDGPRAPIVQSRTLPAADHATLADAMQRYLQELGRPAPPACSIAIANPVVGDQVTMTNHHWTFSIAALKAQMGFAQLLVVNDFTALALALPALAADERRQVGGGAPRSDHAIGLIGPGTGLGVSGLLPDGRGGWLPLQGEGGHITLAGTTPREQAVLNAIGARYGHASAERAVSGQGLVDIHLALAALDRPGAALPTQAAPAITAAALDGSDPACVEALTLFCAFLGNAAGNLALTLGAKGGVYIGGGIVPRLGAWFDASPFRERFEAKGRFRAYLAEMPTYVIQATSSPALLGAARAIESSAPFAGRAA
ncbi:MAG: glucokinase [Piscinibacter sp.]|nr:glucokinase [Piscinibacter sp.]